MEENAINSIIEGNAQSISEVDPEFLNDFIVEAMEHIEKIEMDVLALECSPDNIENVHSLFRSFHTIKGLAGFVEQNMIGNIAHQTETLLDDCRKGNIKINKTIINLILDSSDFIKKLCENNTNKDEEVFFSAVGAHVSKLNDKDMISRDDFLAVRNNISTEEYIKTPEVMKIGEILVQDGISTESDINLLLEKQKDTYNGLMLGQIAVKEKMAEARDVLQSLRIQEDVKSGARNSIHEASHMRIPVQKVDNIADMLGELIIIQSLIEQEANERFNSNDPFISNLLRMSRVTKEIQKLSMSLRMVSLKSTFQKINRIARDTISDLNKNVTVVMSGEDTEIDRGIAEKLLDPLLHLVKNSISHGIEDENFRIENGKNPQGTVSIKACNKRGSVYIEVSDDGKGLDIDRIYKKALEKNLIDQNISYSNDEILNFIFLPGFSTAEKVDNISGRGVGLDVVKTEIYKIGGKVEVLSTIGKGCIFTLKIPINMAVMNGTIVDIMGNNYILPTLQVKQILKPTNDQWISVKGKKTMVNISGNIIQAIPINKVFGMNSSNEYSDGMIVVVELEQKLKALPVRSITGKREIVVKPLGIEFRHLKFVSGASILGDGRVSLILDIEALFKMEGDD
jgi:Chemotaxis protein histidine kinase and related kinases